MRLGKKTRAGLREVDLTAFLQDELSAHAGLVEALGRPIGADAPIFPIRHGGRQSASNIRNRLLAESVRAQTRGVSATGACCCPRR